MRHSHGVTTGGSVLQFVDKIDEVREFDKKAAPRKCESVSLMVVHRIGPKLGEVNVHGAEDIASAFSKHHEWHTGGQMPYNFVIREDGVVEQALAMNDAGMHSLKFNASSIGVALIGDFRTAPPTAAQLEALTLLSMLWVQHCWARGKFDKVDALVKGHDELPGASSDKNKACPGYKLDMKALRASVEKRLVNDLTLAGVL